MADHQASHEFLPFGDVDQRIARISPSRIDRLLEGLKVVRELTYEGQARPGGAELAAYINRTTELFFQNPKGIEQESVYVGFVLVSRTVRLAGLDLLPGQVVSAQPDYMSYPAAHDFAFRDVSRYSADRLHVLELVARCMPIIDPHSLWTPPVMQSTQFQFMVADKVFHESHIEGEVNKASLDDEAIRHFIEGDA